ncbi:hypothetical protein KC946_02050 [Candidatus Saccharibacteria bacterium]|nr:hypothetical protein [Candidatus Saccharibacteria bacterium]
MTKTTTLSIFQKATRKYSGRIFIILFAIVGILIILSAKASTFSIAIEPESGVPQGDARIISDASTSGQKAIKFVKSTPPVNESQPNESNTGPRFSLANLSVGQFLSSRTCNRQRINEDVIISDNSLKGKTFNITDCEIRRLVVGFGNQSPLPENDIPIINIDYSYFPTEFITGSAAKMTVNHSWVNKGASQFKLTDNWASPSSGSYPLIIKNSVLIADYITQPAHSEALQTPDDVSVSGMQFINTVFAVRAGPLDNTGITATINFKGRNSTFDGCYFLWEGDPPVPAWYSVEIGGPNNVVKNSWFEKGVAGYDTNGKPDLDSASYINNKDYNTGQVLSDH